MIKIAFLLDRSNNWLASHLTHFKRDLHGFDVKVSYDEESITGNELVFVLGFTKLLRGEVLKKNKMLLVVHESDLPKGRGFSPVQWQILEGKNEIVVCLISAAENADSGEIFETVLLKLDGSELHDEIREKQARATFDLIYKFLQRYPNVSSKKQTGEPTFYKRRSRCDSRIDVNQSIKSQFNLLRVCNNDEWPAFFELSGKTYQVKIEKVN